MYNKQLERELKIIVQSLKSHETISVLDILEKKENVFMDKTFQSMQPHHLESGINCTCCTLTHNKINSTGFGRTRQEALVNSAKSYLENLITTNTLVPQLRTALKQKGIRTTPTPLP